MNRLPHSITGSGHRISWLLVAFIAALVLLPAFATAQNFQNSSGLSFGFSAGALTGHLNSYATGVDGLTNRFRFQDDFYFYNTVNARYSFRNQEAFQLTLARGSVSAVTDFQDWESLLFENSFNSAMMSADFNLLRFFGTVPPTYNFYGTMGIGLMRKRVGVFPFQGSTPASEMAEEIRSTDILYSFGAGFRIKLISNVDFFIQYDLTRTTSDFFDRSYIADIYQTEFNSVSNSVSVLQSGIQFRLFSARDTRPARRQPRDTYLPELSLQETTEGVQLDQQEELVAEADLSEITPPESEAEAIEGESSTPEEYPETDSKVLGVEQKELLEEAEKIGPEPSTEDERESEDPAEYETTIIRTHTVAPGETLFRIGVRYNVPYRQIMEINNLRYTDTLEVGQVLFIDRADTIETTVEETDDTTQRTHVVQAGENLYRISLIYNVTWQQIALANNLGSNPVIEVGQVLIIP